MTSDLAKHSRIPVISIVSNAISAAAYMMMAKILNIFDRSYACLAAIVVSTLGLILSATHVTHQRTGPIDDKTHQHHPSESSIR